MKDMLAEYAAKLVPAPYDRVEASSRKEELSAALKDSTLDAGLLFESGSWSHGTAIRGKSDVDLMAWASGSRPQRPSTALATAKAAIRWCDYRIVDATVSSPVVQVRYGSAPDFEVVPAWFHDTVQGFRVFKIPGRGDDWVLSSPQAHLKYVNEQNDRLGKKLKGLIRLLKAWKLHVGAPVSSFYLEMRAAEYAAGKASIHYRLDLQFVMKAILRMEARDMNDPKGIVGRIPACASAEKQATTRRLLREAIAALERAESALAQGDQSGYWGEMYRLFGNDFPWPTS